MTNEQHETAEGLVQIYVRVMIRRYPWLDRDDVYSEGWLGALKAARTYDEEKKANFKTWCGWCIKCHLMTFVRDKMRDMGYARHRSGAGMYRKRTWLEFDGPDSFEQIDTRPNPEQQYLLADGRRMLDDLKKDLSPNERKYLTCIQAGMNQVEAMRYMGGSQSYGSYLQGRLIKKGRAYIGACTQ